MTKRARVLLAAMIAVTALGLAACGGDDDDGGASASASDDTDATISDDDLEDAAKAAGVDKECLEGIQAYSSIGASAGAAFAGGTELEKSIKAFQAYADAAPGAIKDEVQVIADAYSGYFQAIADSGWDPSSGQAPTQEQSDALTAASEKIDSTDVKAASDTVSAYFDEHCKAGSGG